jgi:hypothetical protein
MLACGSSQRPLERPIQPAAVGLPLPASTALAVRVDLASLRAELGDTLARQLLLDAVSLGESPSASKLLERSLERASLMWLAVTGAGPLTDAGKVLLVRGHFESLDPSGEQRGWKRQPSGLDALEVPDAEQHPSGYVRLYRLSGDDLLVWAPRGELVEVERALVARRAARPTEPGLEPPERGTLSVAARPEPLLGLYERRYPELVERFRGLRQVEAFAEPTAGTWRADVFLDFATPEQATAASGVVERLKVALTQRSCAIGVVARVLSVTTFERNLRLQAWLEGADLESVRSCVLGSGCCA